MEVMNETSNLHNAMIAFKIKPHQNIDETFKKHSYPGYLNYINKINNLDDLKFIQKDNNIGINQFKKIYEYIVNVEKIGECDKTKNYYKGIKSKYLDKGITSKDVDDTIKWFSTEVKEAINKKAKELKSQVKESTSMTLYDQLMEMVITENKIVRKGYYTHGDYMGWTGKEYEKFENEGAYDEWYKENCNKDDSVDESAILQEMTDANDEYIYGILDESVGEFLDKQLARFNALTKIGLKEEDLANPKKVEAAIKNMENLKDQNKKVVAKCIISLCITVIGTIVGLILSEDAAKVMVIKSAGFEPSKKGKKALNGWISCMVAMFANIIWTSNIKTDYDRVMNAFDKNIKKVEKAIKKEEKKTEPDKKFIEDCKETKDKLVEGKTLVYNQYKKQAAEIANVKEI